MLPQNLISSPGEFAQAYIPTILNLWCMWIWANLESILLRIGRRFGGEACGARRRASGTTDMLEVEGTIAELLGWLPVRGCINIPTSAIICLGYHQ
jgi:hypothetical protein